MRTLLLALVATALAAGAASAQSGHMLAPGSDQIVAPTPSTDPDAGARPSPLPASPGLQNGIAGIAGGANDFPRPHPAPAAARGVTSSASPVSRAVNGLENPASLEPGDYPASWRGSTGDWVVHARACAARYPSYNPATDSYSPHWFAKAVPCPESLR